MDKTADVGKNNIFCYKMGTALVVWKSIGKTIVTLNLRTSNRIKLGLEWIVTTIVATILYAFLSHWMPTITC